MAIHHPTNNNNLATTRSTKRTKGARVCYSQKAQTVGRTDSTCIYRWDAPTTGQGRTYRADWEPEAPSGKCMAGVPGVFWRWPAVLWGPTTHNPTLVAGKTLILKNWPISPMRMWKWGGSAPCGQARLWRPNGPQCAKRHAVWQSPLSRTEKLQTFSIFLFFDLF